MWPTNWPAKRSSTSVSEPRALATQNGKPVVGFEIFRTRGASEVKVAAGAREVALHFPRRDPRGHREPVRRAVEVAAAGGHNLLILGPPGSGKSLIAKRIPTILPAPDAEEFLEILSVYSAAGMKLGDVTRRWERPFRSPHHTISDIGLIGGGAMPGARMFFSCLS